MSKGPWNDGRKQFTKFQADDRPVGEVLWFAYNFGRRFHAFEVVEGCVEPVSVCGNAELEFAADEPYREKGHPLGASCTYCESACVAERPADGGCRKSADGRHFWHWVHQGEALAVCTRCGDPMPKE